MGQFGLYRRAITLVNGDGVAHAAMEDDAHHFEVKISHDGSYIQSVTGAALRTPWTLCCDAVGLLDQFRGLPLAPDRDELRASVNFVEHCSHLFSLTKLLMRNIELRRPPTKFRASMAVGEYERIAMLERDGVCVLRWVLAGDLITEPAGYAGVTIRGLSSWARSNITSADTIELVLILQRAVMASNARAMNLDQVSDASKVNGLGPCYVFRPGFAERAGRVVGSTLDFSDEARDPLETRS